MSDSSSAPDHVTIIKEGNSGSGMFLGIVVAVLVAIAAVWFISSQQSANSTDASIRAAADKVGAAADRVGDAAQDAAKPSN